MRMKNDLSNQTDAQLIAEYVENVRTHDAIDHIGAANRHFKRRVAIAEELGRRNVTTRPIVRELLDHEDPNVRFSTAVDFRQIDREGSQRAFEGLLKRKGQIATRAKEFLKRFEDSEQETESRPQRRELP